MKRNRDLLDHEDPELIAALEYFRQSNGWNASELSRRSDINTSTLSDWMNGRYGPGSEGLRAVCRAFGIARSDFWARGEKIVQELRAAARERQQAADLAQLERAGDAASMAKVLMALDQELREEVLRILKEESELPDPEDNDMKSNQENE